MKLEEALKELRNGKKVRPKIGLEEDEYYRAQFVMMGPSSEKIEFHLQDVYKINKKTGEVNACAHIRLLRLIDESEWEIFEG